MIISKPDKNGDIEIGLGNRLFFLVGSGDPCFEMEYSIKTDIAIDGDILLNAVKKALNRFWNYRLRPYIDENEKLRFKENDQEPPVFSDDGRLYHLGTEEVNNYLFVTLYSDHQITIRGFHGIADGRSQFAFIKAVFYYYLTLSGHSIADHSDVLTDDIPADDSERVCEYEEFGKSDADPFYMYEPQNVFQAKEDLTPIMEKRTVRYDVSCDLNELMDKVRGFKVTMTPFLNAILGRAVYDVYDVDGDKDVIGTCPVDGHAFLGTKALTNFGTTIKLLYDRRFRDLDFKTVVKMQRALMEMQLTKANFEKEFYDSAGTTEAFFKMLPSDRIVATEEFKGTLRANAPVKSTYTISNVGALKMNEEMMKYAKEITLDTCCRSAEMTCVITSFGNRLTISIFQGFENGAYAERVAQLLDEQGVCTKLDRKPDIRFDALLFDF